MLHQSFVTIDTNRYQSIEDICLTSLNISQVFLKIFHNHSLSLCMSNERVSYELKNASEIKNLIV